VSSVQKLTPQSRTITNHRMPSSLKKRSASDFQRFSNAKYKSGYQTLATLQPLNKSKRMGWFLKEQDIPHCEWTASEEDLEYPEHPKGAVIFNYEQTFGGHGSNKSVERGINFTAIRFQRLHASPLIIQETGGNKEMIGTFDHPVAKQLFDEDKELAEKESDYKRKYTVRTMYCVYILTKDNKRAHNKPIVLSIKGLNGVDLSKKTKDFDRAVESCLNRVNEEEISATFSEQVHALSVFSCSFERAMEGQRGVEICGIESFEMPFAESIEEAAEALDTFMIKEEDYEKTWSDQEKYKGYIQSYCEMLQAKLNGQYGIKEGVEILPAVASATKALPSSNPTGEDASL